MKEKPRHPDDIAARKEILRAVGFRVYYRRNPTETISEEFFDAEPWRALLRAKAYAAEIMIGVGAGRRPMVYALMPNFRGYTCEIIPADFVMPRSKAVTV